MTCASIPRVLSQRANQKPSRPVSKATAMRLILCPAFSASLRHRSSRFNKAFSSGSSFFRRSMSRRSSDNVLGGIDWPSGVRKSLRRSATFPSNGWRSMPGMIPAISQVFWLSVETADMLAHEALSRNLRDRRAVARYAGLTGSPEESGSKRREKGLARSGNIRVRRGMIQLAWRFLMFQKGSALARWFRARTDKVPGSRKRMIVALARKLLIALWQFVRDGVVPEGVVLRPA